MPVPDRPRSWFRNAVLAALFAWQAAQRQSPAADQLLALVDARAACGGLLMASADAPLGGASTAIPRRPLARAPGDDPHAARLD